MFNRNSNQSADPKTAKTILFALGFIIVLAIEGFFCFSYANDVAALKKTNSLINLEKADLAMKLQMKDQPDPFIASAMNQKDAEINALKDELDAAKEQIAKLNQAQKPAPVGKKG